MSEPFTMPILGSKPKEHITFIPTDDDRLWSDRNHWQTLERIRERGGFGWCELAAIFERRKWHKMDEQDAIAICKARQSRDTNHA